MKTTPFRFYSTFATILVAFSVTAFERAPAAEAKAISAESSKLDASDEKFLLEAAQGGMLEVRLGELANTKATRPAVKDYGVMMARDHGKAGEDLKAVAAKHGVSLPADLDPERKAIVGKFEKLAGAEFDKAYVAEMVKDHVKDVRAFQDTAKNAKNPDVKAFATRTLPVIKVHLQRIKAIAGGEKKKSQ